MGCGNSRLIPEGESIPARIRPLMRIRFSELTKRKNGSNLETGTLSKKVLLKDTEQLDHEDNSIISTSTHVDNNKKSVSSSFSSISSPSGSSKPKPAPAPAPAHAHINKQEKKSDDEDYSPIPIPIPIPMPLSNNANAATKEDLDDLLKQHNDTHTINGEEEGAENKKTGEEGRPDIEDTRCIICPGSPSFRVYFVEEEEVVDDDKASVEMKDDAGKDNKEDVSHNKSPTHDRINANTTTTTTCANFGEAQDSKVIIKKGKKGSRSCKRAVSKKRQGGVKNLLNVKSCYHLSCSGNDRATLLARKAHA